MKKMEERMYEEVKMHIGHNLKASREDGFCINIECEDCDTMLFQLNTDEEDDDRSIETLDFLGLPF